MGLPQNTASALQSSSLLETPVQTSKNGAGEERTATSTVRRPRNREVNSRYKNSTSSSTTSNGSVTPSSSSASLPPTVAGNHRFPTPSSSPSAAFNGGPSLLMPVMSVFSPKRFQSVERRRPVESPANGEFSSMPPPRRPSSSKSVCVSLHYDSRQPSPTSSVASRKSQPGRMQTSDHALRPSSNSAQRKLSSEYRQPPPRTEDNDQSENSQPLDANISHQDVPSRWSSGNTKLNGSALSRSFDFSTDKTKPTVKQMQSKVNYGTSRAPRPSSNGNISSRVLSQTTNELQKSKVDNKEKREDSSAKSSRDVTPKSVKVSSLCKGEEDEVSSALRTSNASPTDNLSDTESGSSVGTTVTTASSRCTASSARAPRGTHVPARFLQDAAPRSTRSSQVRSHDGDHSVKRHGSRSSSPLMSPEVNSAPSLEMATNGCVSAGSSPWGGVPVHRSLSSSLQAPQPPPPLPRTSPYRNSPSPSRVRVLPVPSYSQSQRTSSAAVMLNFGSDATKRGKKGITQIEDNHQHRLLHNRLLQWRFVNARADAAMETQTSAAEKSLYNVCAKTFELRSSIAEKRIQLQQRKQDCKVNSILSVQMPKLESWSEMEQAHGVALDGSIQALESTVLRVPATGVKVDTLGIKEALDSAFDVMNSIDNSVNYLLPMAEQTNMLTSELAHVVAQERTLLEDCAELFAIASALEVEECSMRTQLMQLESERSKVLQNKQINNALLGAA